MPLQKYKFVPVYTHYNECSIDKETDTMEAANIQDAANRVSKRVVLDMYRDAISDSSADESDLQSMYNYILEFVGDICVHGLNHATIGHGEEEVILVLAPDSPFYNIVELPQDEWVEEVMNEWYKLFESFDSDYLSQD